MLLAAALTACSGDPAPKPHSDTHNDGVVVYSEQSDFVMGLATGAGHLYVLDDLSDPLGVQVMALSTADGSAATLAKVPDDFSAGGIVVDGGYVYFRTMSAVYRVPAMGGPVEALVQSPDGSMSPALAIDGDKLYLGSPGADVLLGVIPKSGGALTELASDPDDKGAYVTQSIAITPAHVWAAFVDTTWSTCIFDSCGPPQQDTDLLRYTKSDGSVFFDASNKDPWFVAAQNGFVYFDSRYRLVRMPDQGGDPRRIMDAVDRLQLAGQSAFWAQDWTGDPPAQLGNLDLVTGETHSYAVGKFHPSALAVDATDVYWEADGKVYRAAR